MGNFFTGIYWSDPLQISGILCVALSSLVFCPENSICLGLPGLSLLNLESAGLCLDSPPCTRTWKHLWNKWEQLPGSHPSFPSLRDHCPSLPDGQCSEICFIYFFQCFWLFPEVNLVPCDSTLGKSTSSLQPFVVSLRRS